MDEKDFERCKWCGGCGTESDNHYPCPDCEGTGFVGGKKAEREFDKVIEKLSAENQ